MMASGDTAEWVRRGRYAWDGPGGTRVSVARVGAGEAWNWRYTAWGMEDRGDLNYWQWHNTACAPECYEMGQATPSRRPRIGVYLSAAEAQQACLAWLARWGGVMPGQGDSP